MATSIDLHMLKQIAFNDKQLLQDMLQEWIIDVADRFEKMKISIGQNNEKEFFNAAHQLKSNYQMIACAEAIHLLEKMIKDKVASARNHISTLDNLQVDTINQINQFINH